ncbi:MAG: tRNA (N(6)-L-threonylcarbamoyladenosine(37)-C(2))-methylthiotransferase MtaB, partial [Bacteroidetes bacterium]|nr:tRNA (N(6)-L-threonylcarbamoyladenosine(37)-C(2))-methylthiotransferase MtaB [Bacteroidota bacterium]
KELMPKACIGVDVIVGFPGETEEEFKKTLDLIHEMEVSYLHVFTYSERPNTTALRMDGIVPVKTRQERNKILRMLSLKKQRAHYQTHTGSVQDVLFESEEVDGRIHGFTENYIKVTAPFDPELVNSVCPVELERVNSDGIMEIRHLVPQA